jgi:hypothetical protein
LPSTIPTWVAQGPASEVNSGSGVGPNNPVSGALESIAVNPNNPAQMIVGTANGGVWRTTNADPNNPAAISWAPLTDQLPSLSIGAVAYDPGDAGGNTFYAGTGLWSSGREGGTAVGLYKTTDAGAHWTVLGGNVLAGHRIKALALSGSTILAGTIDGDGTIFPGYKALGGGLYRSSDGGQTFAPVVGTGPTDLPAGAVPSLLADPNNARRFYATVSGHGVYRSDDGGATWAPVNTGLATPTVLQGADDIELAAQKNGAATILFAGVATGTTMNGAFTSADNGATWTALAALPAGAKAGGALGEYFQLTADPDAGQHPGVVYLEANGVYRYDPSGAGNWVLIEGAGTRDGTAPHVDARDLKFLGTTTLLESDDGGLFFLNNPTAAATSDWQSFNGNLADLELYSAAYDSTNHVVFGSAQDNGSPTQEAPNSPAWSDAGGGDGWQSQVDATSLGGDVFRYYRINTEQKIVRLRVNSQDQVVNRVLVPVTGATVAASGTVTLTSNNHGLQTGDRVVVSGLLGITGLSGFTTFPVTVVDANRFSLNGSHGGGTYLGSGTWQQTGLISSVSGTAGQPIVIHSTNHHLSTGDEVRVSGMNVYTALNESSFYITVLDANTFSLNGTSADGSSMPGGNWFRSNDVLFKSAPGAANLSGLNAAGPDRTDAGNHPFVLDSVDPRRMLYGGFGVYEDAGTNPADGFAGDVVTDITGTVGPVTAGTGELVAGPVTALAYGGQRAGTAEPNVAFVGAFDGHLFFRGESGASFTDATGGLGTTASGHPVSSIALDPKDWRRVYVVKDNQLWFTPDVTNLAAPANAWSIIGGGAHDNLGQLLTAAVSTVRLRGVTVVNGTAVVGALGGVFQTSAPPAGGGAATSWSAFGQGLPHVIVEQVSYDAGDDLLLAATFGRGAWTLPAATGVGPQQPPPTTPPATQPPGTPPPTVSAPQVVRAKRTGAVQAFVLAFSEALDAASATSLTHYQLVVPGKGRKSKPRVVPLLGAAYDPGTHTVTLTVGRLKSSLRKGMLEVSGVTDAAGDVLAGTAVFAVNLQPMKHK